MPPPNLSLASTSRNPEHRVSLRPIATNLLLLTDCAGQSRDSAQNSIYRFRPKQLKRDYSIVGCSAPFRYGRDRDYLAIRIKTILQVSYAKGLCFTLSVLLL
jgi:hypothetical protein